MLQQPRVQITHETSYCILFFNFFKQAEARAGRMIFTKEAVLVMLRQVLVDRPVGGRTSNKGWDVLVENLQEFDKDS